MRSGSDSGIQSPLSITRRRLASRAGVAAALAESISSASAGTEFQMRDLVAVDRLGPGDGVLRCRPAAE